MPWKGVTVDEERQRFLEDYKLNYYSISDLAERFSICRKTAHKWIDRFERHGLEGFHEVSRRPLSCPSRQDTPAQSAGTGPGRCGGRCQGALGLRLPLASSGCCAMLRDAARIPSGDATRSSRPLGLRRRSVSGLGLPQGFLQ
jgi:hypothetical protein